MKRTPFTLVVYLIISLAIIGIVAKLFSDPVNLFRNLFVTIFISSIILSLIYIIFLRKRKATPEMKKYAQAVKQSKAKYNQTPNNTTFGKEKNIASRKKLNRRTSHLRVIDGNKSKNKKRTTL